MRWYKMLWGGAALLGLIAVLWVSGSAHASSMAVTNLLIGKSPVSGQTIGGNHAVSMPMEKATDTADSVLKVRVSSVVIPPDVKPLKRPCFSGRGLVGEFKAKVLAAEKRILASGWVYNHTEEAYFQVAGKKLADGRPVPTHQVGDVWFLLGKYSSPKGALVRKMYSVSKTNAPALTYWAYATSNASYDLSLGTVTPLDEPPRVRFYPEALDMMLKGTLKACGGVQVRRWQGKKVYVFTKQEQYEGAFVVGKGDMALKVFGSGYRLYYDFATGIPVGHEDFRVNAEGKEVLARRVVERWKRQAPPQEIVRQFQQRLQTMGR